MNKRSYYLLKFFVSRFIVTFSSFFVYLLSYLKGKITTVSIFFEANKNNLVKLFMAKRGRYNRPFLHLTTFTVLCIGVIITPFLANTYPVFSQNTGYNLVESAQSIAVGDNVFQTSISQKPRDKTLDYIIQKGDTISTIAEKFGISENTVRWENDLSGDDITVGDTLRILPVTGMSYKVQKGDSVYSIAKKLATEPQKIVDFPFNDFANPETFSLIDGQMLVVPDGVKPSEQQYFRPQVYIATGPVSISSAGFTWPLQGIISQFFVWYHPGIDIAAPVGTPIVAAQSGTVTRISLGTWDGGYGNNIEIKNGNGDASLYSHLSSVNVSAGDDVTAGKTVIGWVGLTGRTTGPHLHFEIRKDGALVNPLSYLQ